MGRRAVLATRAAQDGRITVIRAERLRARGAGDPMARLMLRVHLEPPTGPYVLGEPEPVNACYDTVFVYYGRTEVERVRCPADARLLTAVPGPPVPTPSLIPELENPFSPEG
jgi:hypothetical protein